MRTPGCGHSSHGALLVLTIAVGPQEQKSVAMIFLFSIAVIFRVLVVKISLDLRTLMRRNSSP